MKRLDLRLTPMALCCWAATLSTLYGGWRAGLALAVAGVVASGLLWVNRPRWQWIVAGALIGLVCGTTATWSRLPARDADELRDLVTHRATATVELTLRDDPRLLATPIGSPAMWLIRADLPAAGVRVLVFAENQGWRELLPGQRVRASVRFGAPRGGDLTAAVLSATSAPELIGAAPWVQRAAGGLRAGLQRACTPLHHLPGGLLPGLVVGDTTRLDPVLEQEFRDAGLTHLTAVSGSNVAIFAGCVILLARWLRVGPRWTAALAAMAVVGFVILARPSPSVLRAAVMGAIGLLALAGGRKRMALPALSATTTLLLLIDPDLAGDAGFALSVLATGGLLLLAPPMRDALLKRRVPSGVAEALAVPAAAQLACAPVIAGLSGTVSLASIPANLLATPAVAPATLSGVAAAGLSPIWPDAAAFAAWLGSWPAWWLVKVAHLGSEAPASVAPWPDGTPGALLLAGLSVLLLLGFRNRMVRRVVLVAVAAVALGTVPVRLLAPGWPPPGWLIALCDVGQGDALLLRTGVGAAILIDAGPRPEPLRKCLDDLDIEQVPLVVLSHFHVDHVGGLDAVLQLKPRRIVVPAWPEPQQSRNAVLASAKQAGVPVTVADPAAQWTVGEVNLRVLSTAPLSGTRSDPNNNSLLLWAQVGGVRVLMLGDAEVEQQALLRLAYPGLGTDVLKVAHHGSAYQDLELLESLRARVALVSVGAGNDYGHPNASVLAALRRNGSWVLRTDVDGPVALTGRDGRLEVVRR